MAFYAVTDTDDYVWATLSMSTVENLLAASKPNSTLIAADRKIDKQTMQAGTGPREEASQTKHVGKTTVRNIDFDAETQTVIFQTIDENTDSVISQYPSEAQLNLSAYLKTVTAPKAQSVSFSRSA